LCNFLDHVRGSAAEEDPPNEVLIQTHTPNLRMDLICKRGRRKKPGRRKQRAKKRQDFELCP
jgi:hypothetical protein